MSFPPSSSRGQTAGPMDPAGWGPSQDKALPVEVSCPFTGLCAACETEEGMSMCQVTIS